jgi:hypothetical protein
MHPQDQGLHGLGERIVQFAGNPLPLVMPIGKARLYPGGKRPQAQLIGAPQQHQYGRRAHDLERPVLEETA